ncbi:unnamed protein product [Haemonchus placei]|uniref:Heat shock factor-binding protein 1 n=1 Tax=Haemonchus placei TaxID=6290 RepID=A0A0N4W0C5_HAEPC|nr:unnamed protein product [Haemonchus placei]
MVGGTVDTTTMLSMFTQLMEEQRSAISSMMSTIMKEQKDIRVIESAPERDQRVRKAEEPLALPNVMQP